MSVLDDIKAIKGCVIGVLTFATAVSAFLVEVCEFNPERTLLIVAGFAMTMIFMGLFLQRSENRQYANVRKHESDVKLVTDKYDQTLKDLHELAIQTRLDTLRVQLTQYYQYSPQNHDTILKLAEKYFLEMHGDWVATDEFGRWITSESKKGRPVTVPHELMSSIANSEHK